MGEVKSVKCDFRLREPPGAPANNHTSNFKLQTSSFPLPASKPVVTPTVARRVDAPCAPVLPEAVILGQGPNALGAIRSLAVAKVPVRVVSFDAHDPVMCSRCAHPKHFFPGDLLTLDGRLCDYLETQLPAGAVLIPTSDILVLWMIAQRVRLEKAFHFCIPSTPVAQLLLDKARQIEAVRGFGVPVPPTVALTRPLEEITTCLRLPIIVKPATPQALHALGEKNRIVQTAAELQDFARDHHYLLPDLLAQEMVPGPDSRQWVCNCTFDRAGRLIRAFVFQRLSLYPPHRGQTSYARSRWNEDIVALVAQIGRRLGYTGPAMLEFKYDDRDGCYKYLETNPRLGQCNFFDTRCGVNNVHATYLLALGRDLPARLPRQRDNVMFLNLLFDLRGRLADRQKLAAAVRLYLRDLALPHVGQWQYWRDPLPALAHTARCLLSGLRHLRQRWMIDH
jgi:D-aspartate ligase